RGFAAPELYDHDVKFTSAVDTYAFGATALFLGLRNLPADLTLMPPKPGAADYFSAVPFGLAHEIASLLNLCLHPDPSSRPTMRSVRDLLAKHLLHERHRALVVFQGNASYLDAARRSVRL
ncbi:MAG: hypothetical protein ACOVN2_04795, partial [Usitatibacteraceae bacterium]